MNKIFYQKVNKPKPSEGDIRFVNYKHKLLLQRFEEGVWNDHVFQCKFTVDDAWQKIHDNYTENQLILTCINYLSERGFDIWKGEVKWN